MKKKLTPIIICLVVICIVLIITQSDKLFKEPVSKTDFYLNTTCTIEIHDMNKKDAEELIDKAFGKCGYYEGLLSRTIKTSDIYKINHANGEAVTVDPETADVINEGLKKSKESNGSFDITVGKLTDLWNFSGENPKVPDKQDIEKALATVGYEKVHIHENQVQLTDKNTWLDLGAIAKGYIADRVSQYLISQGVTSGIVNLGGNIVTIGNKEDDTPWNIGLETPYTDKNEILGSIKLKDKTLVTSGIYERHFEENGKDYHHVLNPKTGYPYKTNIVSVSILSKLGNSSDCDGYSTVCLTLGKEKAIQFMKDKKDFEYCIVDTDGNITKSDGFNLIEEK